MCKLYLRGLIFSQYSSIWRSSWNILGRNYICVYENYQNRGVSYKKPFNRPQRLGSKKIKGIVCPHALLMYGSYNRPPIRGNFLHSLDFVLRPKNSIRSLPTSFRTLVSIKVLRRENTNPWVQNTFKISCSASAKNSRQPIYKRPINPV